jgi:sigma-B regulation protein RsbU (phosphoserine phosphatase)
MFRSLTTRLIVWILAVTGAVFIITIGLSNRAGRSTAIDAAEREANNDTDAAVLEVDDVLNSAEESVAALARSVSELRPSLSAQEQLVRRFSSDMRGTIARYVVIRTGDGDAARAPGWYSEAMQRGTPAWTEPYKDPDLDNATVITRVVPLAQPGGGPAGAVAASLRLDFLSRVVREVHLGASGFALVLSRGGLLIAHSRLDLSERVLDPVASLPPALRAVLEPVVQRALAGESGFVAVPFNNGRMFRLTFRPIEGTGWILATAYAEDELLADVSSLRRTQIGLALSGLAVLAIAVVVLSRRVTGPLTLLAASAGRLATGDLDGPLPEPRSNDEVGALTAAFRHMQESLKSYIRNLRETTAEKERLEGEMLAARRIQADMLPSPTAGGADAPYELAAVLEPARSVGGDLFDHFEVDGRLCFFVGDVSGKGVAAALFMARARTLFDQIARSGMEPGAMLAVLNDSLCRQNEAGMFVTAVSGVLDLHSRFVTVATAGHEPPIVVPAQGPSAPMPADSGRVLGLMEGGTYPNATATLERGTSLVMYTDGVPEARDPADDFFGSERLLAAIDRVGPEAPPAAVTSAVLREVKAFTGTAPQSDDITILTLTVH